MTDQERANLLLEHEQAQKAVEPAIEKAKQSARKLAEFVGLATSCPQNIVFTDQSDMQRFGGASPIRQNDYINVSFRTLEPQNILKIADDVVAAQRAMSRLMELRQKLGIR
jgi:hypothetical protein